MWYRKHGCGNPCRTRMSLFKWVLSRAVIQDLLENLLNFTNSLGLYQTSRIPWDYIKLHEFPRTPNLQLLECTCSLSHNVPFRTEICTFLFWMEHCGIWNRRILGFVKLVYCNVRSNPVLTGPTSVAKISLVTPCAPPTGPASLHPALPAASGSRPFSSLVLSSLTTSSSEVATSDGKEFPPDLPPLRINTFSRKYGFDIRREGGMPRPELLGQGGFGTVIKVRARRPFLDINIVFPV